jgi:hypothetical protein
VYTVFVLYSSTYTLSSHPPPTLVSSFFIINIGRKFLLIHIRCFITWFADLSDNHPQNHQLTQGKKGGLCSIIKGKLLFLNSCSLSVQFNQ